MTPRPRFKCPEDDVRSPSDQGVHFGLVCHQHLADHTKTAGLPQEDQSRCINVNHERDFPDAHLRFAPWASSESLACVEIEEERVARRQRAHPIVVRSSSAHVLEGANEHEGVRIVGGNVDGKNQWLVDPRDLGGPAAAPRPSSCRMFAVKGHAECHFSRKGPNTHCISSANVVEHEKWAEKIPLPVEDVALPAGNT